MFRNMKKLTICLTISLIIFFVISYIYNGYIKVPYKKCYVLNKDVYRGEKIQKSDVEEINILSNSIAQDGKMINIDNEKQCYAKYDLRKGQTVTEYVITNSGKLNNSDSNQEETSYEYIAIELETISDSFAYNLKKGDIVNVYYTCKASQVDNIFIDKEKIYSSNLKESMVTIKMFEKLEIIGIYDLNGNEINNNETNFSILSTLAFRIKSEESMVVNNIKGLGTFSVTKVE